MDFEDLISVKLKEEVGLLKDFKMDVGDLIGFISVKDVTGDSEASSEKLETSEFGLGM